MTWVLMDWFRRTLEFLHNPDCPISSQLLGVVELQPNPRTTNYCTAHRDLTQEFRWDISYLPIKLICILKCSALIDKKGRGRH